MSGQLKQMKGKPGLFQVKTAKGTQTIKLVEWVDSYIYDTVEVAIGALVPGAQYALFSNLQNKNRIDCNLATMRRLTSGTEMIMNQIGVFPGHVNTASGEAGALDYAQLCERLVYELRINNVLITEGPVHCYPAGLGVVGNTVTGTGVVTNGLASQAAIPRLLVPQNLNADNDLQGMLTHSACAWTTAVYVPPIMAAGMFLRNTIRGYIKTAVGKG